MAGDLVYFGQGRPVVVGGGQMLTAVGGVILGIIILYLPDNDLKEISKL